MPAEIGGLHAKDILVSNFNNVMNSQGTGTTIVQVAPGDGSVKLFAKIDPRHLPGPCPGGVGLTTALVVLRSGFVIVGSLPTTDGTSATAMPGCLLVLNSTGTVVETMSGGLIDGPWDTALDMGSTAALFVTNVLDGTVKANGGTVTNGIVIRIDLSIGDSHETPVVTSTTMIGSGFSQRTDPAALVIGITGVGLNNDSTLYIADTLANRIAAIPDAVTRATSAEPGLPSVGAVL